MSHPPSSDPSKAGTSILMKAASDELLESVLRDFESEKTPSGMSNGTAKSNSSLVDLLDQVQALYEKKKELNKRLQVAIFDLTYAQKYQTHGLSIEDAREDIEASVRIKTAVDQDGEKYWVKVESNSDDAVNDLESLSILNGLPNLKLRKAQKEFREALNMSFEVSRLTMKLEEELR